MNPTRSLTLAAALLASLPAAPLFAQTQPRTPTAAEVAKAERDKKLKSIDDRLRGVGGRPADPATEQAAVDELKTWVTEEAAAGREAADLAMRFQNTLVTRHPADFVAMIDVILPKVPETRFDQRRELQSHRIRCLLKLNKNDDAFAAFNKLLNAEGPANIRQLCDDMIPILLRLQKYAEVEDLETQLILAKPEDTVRTGETLAKLVAVYNLEKKFDKAAGVAKQYFAFSQMSRTSDAMLIVAKQLPLSFPDDKTIADRFRQEQIDGQFVPPGSDTQPAAAKTSAVLAKIKVDAAPYEAAAKDILDIDFDSLIRRGNLLLLADHPAEAKSCFESALTLAAEKNQVQNGNAAAEGIARSLKALDGTIGRANAYAASVSNK